MATYIVISRTRIINSYQLCMKLMKSDTTAIFSKLILVFEQLHILETFCCFITSILSPTLYRLYRVPQCWKGCALNFFFLFATAYLHTCILSIQTCTHKQDMICKQNVRILFRTYL